MPKATTPQEISQLIGDAITAGDLEAALSLYEPEATFVMPAALGEGSVTAETRLRAEPGRGLAPGEPAG